jgi:hypothetical protein
MYSFDCTSFLDSNDITILVMIYFSISKLLQIIKMIKKNLWKKNFKVLD